MDSSPNGSSRVPEIQAGEEGTHERLKAHLGELVDPKIKEHRGRTVKNAGDGMLAEFPSVIEAVRCAAEVQRGMIDRNTEQPADQTIEFRIGINLGDVIVEEHDIFGDGVNIAARLEALAEPGGICISGTVYDQIRDKLPYPFDDRASRASRTLLDPCGSMQCALKARPSYGHRAYHPRRQFRSPPLRHACRSWCYRLPISVTMLTNNISRTASPRI